MEEFPREVTQKVTFLYLLLVNSVDVKSEMENGGHSNCNRTEFKISVWPEEKCQQNLNSEHKKLRLEAALGISELGPVGKYFPSFLCPSLLVTF